VSTVLPGTEFPLGAPLTAGGTNFAVASAVDGVLLCLFDSQGAETQIPLGERDDGSGTGPSPGLGPARPTATASPVHTTPAAACGAIR
jgi:isoamylase